MANDFEVNLGDTVPYLVDRFAALLGKDEDSRKRAQLLKRRLRQSANLASVVQCVGMAKPIPINEIYQVTRLIRPARSSGESQRIEVSELVGSGKSFVIFGGPGRGKSTLLHWIYGQVATARDNTLPILFPLRWPGIVDDLKLFVELLSDKKPPKELKGVRALLLIDGYDELSFADRKKVSAVLRDALTIDRVQFILTCRAFYDVIDLSTEQFYIDSFSSTDALKYVTAFAKAYGAKFSPEALVTELHAHGFEDFISHPLLLALICILKTGPMPTLPSNSIGLIRRALDTLTFRWDESKGLHRTGEISLDGEERIRCLMRIAYEMRDLVASDSFVYGKARDYLALNQHSDVDGSRLLKEVAGFYGIFIPASEATWTWVHRSMQDFLAARYWVETGLFSPSRVGEWDARAAYAACLIPDATDSLVSALRSKNLYAFTECLYNRALFSPRRVARATVDHFARYRGFTGGGEGGRVVMDAHGKDFFGLASNDFLDALIEESCQARNIKLEAKDFLLFYSLAESLGRSETLSARAGAALKNVRFKDSFEIEIWRTTDRQILKISPDGVVRGTLGGSRAAASSAPPL